MLFLKQKFILYSIFALLGITNVFGNITNNSFEIRYSNSVPDSIKPAVQEAFNIWDKYINNTVPIVVSINWTPLKSTVSAYARPTQNILNHPSLPINDKVFPIPLAEHIIGRSLNDDNVDIELVLSSTNKWYTNLELPTEDYDNDLITIILHELAHGFGLTGSFTFQNNAIVLTNLPSIYDTYLYHTSGTSCIDFYNNLSISTDSIVNIFTSSSIFWKGKHANTILNSPPTIYAPSSYNLGSSLYHFNSSNFNASDPNSLMVPELSKKAYRDVGSFILALLSDIGWNIYFISDISHNNISDVTTKIDFSVTFNTDIIDTSYVELFYSYDNGKNFQIAPCNSNASNDTLYSTLPQINFERTIYYFYKTRTHNNDTLFFPSNYYQSFVVGHDLSAPEILHNSISNIFVDLDTLSFKANFIDNFGIDSSYIKIIIGRNNFATVLSNSTYNFWNNRFNYQYDFALSPFSLKEGDQIAYNIYTVDINGNVSSLLTEGNYQIITIEPNQAPINYYITNFEDDSILNDFYFDKLSVEQPTGFSNKALHSLHPYVSSYIDGQYVQYSAQLKQPIIIASNPAIIEFDHIVLVEPGKSGVEYGNFGFWDYVVVEGTKDLLSNKWYPIGKKGFDSNIEPVWSELFFTSLSSEDNNSSTAVATEDNFKHYSLNLLENKQFREGDTIFLRFRLQADYSKHGWGWAIDNLKIQEKEALSIFNKTKHKFTYPSPCNDVLNVTIDYDGYTIFNLLGQPIMSGDNESNQINTSTLDKGVYFLKLNTKYQIETCSFVKK